MKARELIADALFVAGSGAVTFGAYLLSPPVGWIVGGALALGAGLALGRAT